jgi:hypothetical protein
MSLHPEDPTSLPEETRRVARAAFPKGTLCLDTGRQRRRDPGRTFAEVGKVAALG